MNKRNLKFALLLEDGKPVRSIDELRMYYDIDKVLAYFHNGQLERWLEQNEYEEQFKMIQTLKETMHNELINSINSILIEGKKPTRFYEGFPETKIEDEFFAKPTNLKHPFNTPLEVEEGVEMIEDIYDSYKVTDEIQINREEIQSLFDKGSTEVTKCEPNMEIVEIKPIMDEPKASIFKKPLFLDKDEEIYGLSKRNPDEGFKLKNRGKTPNVVMNISTPFTIKEPESITSEPKKAKIADFDFFDDDFFYDGEDNSSEKAIDSDKLSFANEEKAEISNSSLDPLGQINNFEENNIFLENDIKVPIKKFKFGLDKINTLNDNNKALNIALEPMTFDAEPQLGAIPASNKIYSESEIEDNRKQLLQLKKNSVFSKLKADNSLPNSDAINKMSIEPKASTIEKEKTASKLSNALDFEPKDDITSFVKDPSSVEMINDYYVKNKQNDINDVENASIEFPDDDDNLNSNIDIDNIIQKINHNVEKNAKLYNDYEDKKEENNIFNQPTMLNHKALDNIQEPTLEESKNDSTINYIDPTMKLYKGTVYSQKDYEELLERRVSPDTRLRVIVSCNNLKIRDTYANIEYLGVNKPTILLVAKTEFDAIEANMSFTNLKISSLGQLMFNYDKLDNVTIDKTKIKKGIRELIDKYPGMALNYNKYDYLMEDDNEAKDGRSVEAYVEEIFSKGMGNGKLMATINFDGLHIYTNIIMGVINMAFCRTTNGGVHDISDFFVGSDPIDVLSKDDTIGIEYVAMITEDIAEVIKKDSNKDYSSVTEIVEDIFLNEDMYKYLEHVILSPIKIFKLGESISRIDQIKMIDIMNLDTNIPYICKVYEGDKEVVKTTLIDFIKNVSENKTENGIKFKGVNIEFLSEEFEYDDKNNIIYNF